MMDFVSLLAIAASVGAGAHGGTANQPIRLEVESEGDTNIVRVVADSSALCTATYELAVTGSGGGNRSVNRGTVRLPSRGPTTVATVKVSRSADAATTATLNVSTCDGKPYQQLWTSAESPARG
jgi:hypothetical protein